MYNLHNLKYKILAWNLKFSICLIIYLLEAVDYIVEFIKKKTLIEFFYAFFK